MCGRLQSHIRVSFLAQADRHEQGFMLVRETNRTYEVPGDSEQIVRAAWLYHVAGNTQEQTADLLGISRVKVNRLLAEAREFGIVKISIEHRFARMVEVEESIRRRYNLTFCRSTPPIVSYSPARRKSLPSRSRLEAESPIARRAVAIVAAELLRERLQADESSIIGVGWGRTMAAVPDHLTGMSKPSVKFVSVMGSLTRTSAANLFEVVYQFAERTGGEGHFLPVPFIANTIADRQIFMSQRIFKETLALAEQASFYMATFGPCDEHSLLFKQRYLSGVELQDLKRAGAVCDCLGKFFNADGKVAQSDVNQRTISVELDHLFEREVILLCAGREKLQAVQALLKAGFVNGLIIDGDTALLLSEVRG
jgi:DNA-binding transcriptional regulator LsrR (DeoR family)